MGSNKRKKKTIQKRQQELKSGATFERAQRSWADQREALYQRAREAEKDKQDVYDELEALRKDNPRLAKELKHERKLREDMWNGTHAARESLTQIREMHQAGRLALDQTSGRCVECGRIWPCPTLEAIREPEQAVITSLQVLERTLSKTENPE